MQALKKFYFGKQKVKVPNTFIGGIGGTINTPALLASRLGISENRIKLFKVTGVDVECAIVGGSYVAGLDFMGNLSELTFFNDSAGLITSNSPSQGKMFSKCYNLQTVILPNISIIYGVYGNWVFENTYGNYTKWKAFYAPKLVQLGSSVINNGDVFRNNFSNNIKLYTNPYLQTINSGGVEGDLALFDSLGTNSVVYVTNFTPPNPVTNLSVGTIYNTAVQLNFTPPTSVNGVDFYECYANGKLMNEIKSSGDYIAGLTASTNYNIRIVAVDMFYNKSELSNTVNVSTTNRVATDVDAIYYINASSNTIFQDIIDDMFIGFKTQGLYTKIQAFYPFLGTTQAQHKWNAKNPLDTNAAFRLQFFGGGTHSNLGYQCNGTNAYANTFFVPSANTSVENSGITLVSGTNNPAPNNNTLDFGSEQTTPYPGFELSLRRRNGTVASDDLVGFIGTFINTSQNGVVRITDSDIRGATTVVSTSLSNRKLFQNGQLLITDTKITTNQLPTIPAYIGCLNNQGSPYGYSNQRIQFTAIHEGLTDAEVIALHTIIDNFESAIGRKTW